MKNTFIVQYVDTWFSSMMFVSVTGKIQEKRILTADLIKCH